MAFFVDGTKGRELMKKGRKGKKKKRPSARPSGGSTAGLDAATVQKMGYVKIGSSVYNINGFRHPGGSVRREHSYHCRAPLPLTDSPTSHVPPKKVINTCKGRDCTSLFQASHKNAAQALSKVARYKVGRYSG